MMMKTSSCESQLFLKVLFQNTCNINDKLAITLFHPEVHKLAALVASITYDTASNKLMEVSLEAI